VLSGYLTHGDMEETLERRTQDSDRPPYDPEADPGRGPSFLLARPCGLLCHGWCDRSPYEMPMRMQYLRGYLCVTCPSLVLPEPFSCPCLLSLVLLAIVDSHLLIVI